MAKISKTREQIKKMIDDNITENNSGDITGLNLNQILNIMVDNYGDTVEPNPVGVAQRELETIKIGNQIYKLKDGGTNVVANPSGDPTTVLEKIKIGETIYTVPQGQQGENAYIHIKYAAAVPASDTDIHSTPQTGDKWIGVYSGNLEEAPTAYTSYIWSKYAGENGIDGISPTVSTTQVPGGTQVTLNYGSGQSTSFVVSNGTDGHNPNLGAYVTTDNGATFTPILPLDPQSNSDFIIVVDKTDPSNVTATIWTWDDTLDTPAWQSTGRDANMAYFGSGELLSDVNIDDTHLINPKSGTLPTAEDVLQLKAKLEGVTAEDIKVQLVTSGEGQNVYEGYINGSTGAYVQSAYNRFIVVPLNGAKSVRWLGKENTANSSYLGWVFGTFSGEIDATLSTFTALSKGVYANNPLDNQAVEYVKDAPEGATHAVITIWIYKSGGGSAVTMNNFYCYLQSGESVGEMIGNKVTINKVPYVDYSKYCVWDSTKVIRGTDATLQSSTYGNAGYTDFIPVDNMKGLYCSNPFVKGSGSVIFTGGFVYNSNKEKIRQIGDSTSANTSKWYIKQEGDAYVRFNLGEGAVITELTNDIIVTPSDISNYEALKISEGAVVDNQRLFAKVTGKNLCNPDKLTLQDGLYIKYNSGNVLYASSADSKGITDFIPMNGKPVKCNHAKLSGNMGWAVYDENYHYIRGSILTSIVNFQEGDCYVRFSLNATSEIQVEYGTVSTEYEPYIESVCINEKMIPDKDKELVTIDDISPTDIEYLSENICNPETCHFGNDKYISRVSGTVQSYTSSSIGGCTDYIPIDSRGLSFSPILYSGTAIGGAVYDSNKQYIRSAGSSGIVAYKEGDAYVRFTLGSGASANNVMVNVGTVLKNYVPYLGTKKVISQEILPKFSDSGINYEDGVSIVLPSNIYCTKGDTLYLYWRSFIEAVNPKVFDCCSPNSATTNNVLSYPDCLKITRTSDIPFNVVVRDNDLNEVAKKTVNFKAVNVPMSPASAVNVLLVGASREANGVTPLEVYRRLVGDNTMSPAGLGLTNVNFVGRKGCKAYDCEQLGYPSSLYSQVKHEAVSGKKIHDMVVAGDLTGYTFYFEPNEGYIFNQGDKYTDGTRVYTVVGSDPAAGDLQVSISSGSGTPSATGTLTLTEGSGAASVDYTSYENETSNPFWNSSTGKIDFAKYSTDYCNGATINILVLCRVMNDLWNGRTPSQIVADYTTVIDAFHEYNPSGYVVINLAVLPSMYGGLPHSYTNGKPLSTAWYTARINLEIHKLLIELGESDEYKDFCLLSNTNAEFDLDYFYSKEATTIRNRGVSKTVNYDNNGLHFSATGKQVVADSIYHCVCKIINDINEQ